MVRIRGGPSAEALSGGPGRDRLSGGPGADSLDGGGGRDRLHGGAGDDRLRGQGGDDRLLGAAGRDRLLGGVGDDRLLGGAGADRLHGGRGDDTLLGGRGRGDALHGGPGDDALVARGPGALLAPGLGADTVRGPGDASLSYADLDVPFRIDLRAGRAVGDGVRDSLSGVALIVAGPGDDTLKGGARREWEGFAGGPGNDRIDGRAGHDEALYGLAGPPAGVHVDLAAGRARDGFGGIDRLKRIEAVSGTHHDDVLKGGGSPFESFAGLAGDDVIRGRGGADRVDYGRDARAGGSGGVDVDLRAGIAIDPFGDRDRLHSIEAVVGTPEADRIVGNARDNRLQGGEGRDSLAGGPGRDRLEGGPGRDRLEGGGGADRFEWAAGDGRDRLVDFRPGTDRLVLSDLDATGFHELAWRETPRGALLRLGPSEGALFVGLAPEDLGPGDVWLL